jgi:hypothetical protein
MNKSAENVINDYQPITLEEMDSVKLMNRIDTKYVINRDLLPSILDKINGNYKVLEIKDQRIFPYESLYYDTNSDFMYMAHHNGKLNRYKIRFRKYVSSNLCFLEIKYKVKGTRTIKYRTIIEDIETTLSKKAKNYIEKYTPFQDSHLVPKIYTNFSRITLVNNELTERVTIDLNLNFKQNGSELPLENICIIEMKRDTSAGNTILIDILNNLRASNQGFSKYCIGRAMLEKELKANNFKERILTINKINNGKYFYRDTSQG